MIFRFGEKIRSPIAPLPVTGPHISDANIHKAAGRVEIFGRSKRDGRLIVGRATADVNDNPAIGKANDGWFATPHNLAAEDPRVKIRRARYVGYCQKMREHNSLTRRK